MIDYSVTTLLTSLKTRAMTASNQNLFSDADFVRIMSEELQEVIIPYIESIKGEYFVVQQDVPFVQGVNNYTIPERATGTKLRDVCLVDSQGSEVRLKYINPEDLKSSWSYAPYQFGFYPKGDQIIIILGNLQNTGNYASVRMKYFRRPNVLCITDLAGQVQSINTGTNEVTLTFAPTTWTATTVFDAINSLPPFQSRVDNQAITNIAGFILTFSSLPTGLVVGDWVSEANFSPIPQVPVEVHRLLEALGAARVLQYAGDPAFQVAQAQAEAMKKDLIYVLNPRVDGESRKLPFRNPLWGSW